MIKENTNIAIVYRIYEKSTGRQYIGSTVLGKWYKDLNEYITKIKNHTMHDRYISDPSNYSLIIIKKFKTRGDAYTYESKLLIANNAHNNTSFYNRCLTGSDGRAVEMGDKTRAKISKNHARYMLGKKHTAETKAKISKSKSGERHQYYGKIAHNRKYDYDSSIPTPSWTKSVADWDGLPTKVRASNWGSFIRKYGSLENYFDKFPHKQGIYKQVVLQSV